MFQPPRGTRDFLPELARQRQIVIDRLRAVFETYGFDPADSPAFEYWDVLTAKGGGGEEIKKQIYHFKDKSGRELGLRFDLTVPLARLIAAKPEIPKPFKRYQIGPVWRYEEIKAGRRYREFWQADVDIVGVSGPHADAELLAVGAAGLQTLGLKFWIRLNSRLVLEGLTKRAGIPTKLFLDVCRALDKLDRFGPDVVKKELKQMGISETSIKKLFSLTQIKGDNDTILESLRGQKVPTEDLEDVLRAASPYGVEKFITIWPALARGLDYYTGLIFEFYIEGKEEIGAVAAGGRYDRLIETYGGKPTPATGLSFGIDRLLTATKSTHTMGAKIYIAAIKDELRDEAIKLAQKLRAEGVAVHTDLALRPLSKQLEFASKIGTPYVVFVGPKELKSGKFTLRDMSSGEEFNMPVQEIIKKLKE